MCKIKGLFSYQFFLLFTIFVNLSFPKAGFYVGRVPICASYFLAGIAGLVVLFRFMIFNERILNLKVVFYVLILSIVYILFLYSTLFREIDELTFFIYSINIFIIPVCSILITTSAVNDNLERFKKVLLVSFYIVVVYGLISFVAISFFHINFHIPYISETGGSLDVILGKNNDRGFIYKGVSTYNNGNILGICCLLWFPLIYVCTNRNKHRLMVFLLYLQTFSRTVFFAAAFQVGIIILNNLTRKKLFIFLSLFAALIIYLILFKSNKSFLFDTTVGGRLSQYYDFFDPTLWYKNIITIPGEVVYTGVVMNFGLLGLLVFIVLYSSPLALQSDLGIQKAAKISIITYLFAMAVDGAFIFTPVQFIFWMVVGIIIGKPKEFSLIKNKNLAVA